MEDKKFSNGKQWVIDTNYNDYRDFLDFLIPNPTWEYSEETAAYHSCQYPLWINRDLSSSYQHKDFTNFKFDSNYEKILEKSYNWAQYKLIEHKIFKKIIPVISWYVEYQKGGWMALHNHDPEVVTQVLYIDPTDHLNETSGAKDYVKGAMYAIFPSDKNLTYLPFTSYPGRSIIMSGDIFHGVYPVESERKRTIVIDYKYYE